MAAITRGPAGLAVVRAGAEERARLLGLLGMTALWLVYTRFFIPLQAAHTTLPPCPFLYLTGHPCPFCGGTRSFNAMWRGDGARAAALYPLGPLMFWVTLLAVPALAAALLLNRTVAVQVSRRVRRAALAGGLAVLGASWILKLTVLPN